MTAQVASDTAIRQFVEGMNALDPEAMISTCSSDAVIRYPGRKPMDLDSFRQFLQQTSSLLSTFHLEEKERFGTDHGVAVRWVLEANTKAGRYVRSEGISSWLIGPDGKIQEYAAFYDPTALFAALKG